MNVLIIDDNADDRRLLRYTLEHHGCVVCEAQDGLQGLEKAASHQPDFIISDALMPRMDGFQLLRALKADPMLTSIPFLFYSATYTGEQEARLALSLGAAAFVVKPAEPEELWARTCAIMKAVHEQHEVLPPVPLNEHEEHQLLEYSRIVAAKLEEKVLELEVALAQRSEAEERLRTLNAELTREITDRTRAETDLKEQEQELSTIFENAPFVMLLLDRDRRVRRANSLARLLTGSSISSMLGRRSGEALNCLHALDIREGCGFGPFCLKCVVRLTVIDTFETGQSHYQVETSLPVSVEGKEQTISLLFSTTIVTVAHQAQVLISLQDISEYKKLESQLRHAQKMESIGTLAGGIAHDFNNILTTIFGYGEITLMNMGTEDPHRHNIETILQAAQRAATLARDLLLFSRKQISNRSTVDLNEIIRSLEKFLLRVIGEDISCAITLADGKIPVFADAHQLEQVLMNFATNARDAMPNGGSLSITTELALLDEEFTARHEHAGSGMHAMLTVTDTGSGMDDETRRQIFDPFFTTKEIGKGTGLGLAVVYGIVKQHDGYIKVSSEPGRGTSFRLYLPLAASISKAVPMDAQHETPVGGTETILLAEDDERVRFLAQSLLLKFGYEVIVAVDGEDAVQKFRENRERIRLLLLDMIMPRKNGKEAFDEIRAIEPGIKVIYTSGYAMDAALMKKLAVDNAVIIAKPYVPTSLLSTIRRVLQTPNQPQPGL